MEEIWKKIEGYDHAYEVSNLGRIKSPSMVIYEPNGVIKKRVVPETILKGTINPDGYIMLRLIKEGKKRYKALHFFVLSTFGRPKNRNEVCNHIDSNKLNNIPSNLEWVSIKEILCHYHNTKKKYSKYSGVTFDKGQNVWKSCTTIRDNGVQVRYNLGTYKHERSAALAVLKFNQERGIINKYFIASLT